MISFLCQGLHWKCRNKKSVGQLWIEMLRFYSVVCDLNSLVICLRASKPVSREEKKWASKKLAIEGESYDKESNLSTVILVIHLFH